MKVYDRTESLCRVCGEPIKDIGVNYWLHDHDTDHEAEPLENHPTYRFGAIR